MAWPPHGSAATATAARPHAAVPFASRRGHGLHVPGTCAGKAGNPATAAAAPRRCRQLHMCNASHAMGRPYGQATHGGCARAKITRDITGDASKDVTRDVLNDVTMDVARDMRGCEHVLPGT